MKNMKRTILASSIIASAFATTALADLVPATQMAVDEYNGHTYYSTSTTIPLFAVSEDGTLVDDQFTNIKWKINNKLVARGSSTSIPPMPAGDYPLKLVYYDEGKQETITYNTTLNVVDADGIRYYNGNKHYSGGAQLIDFDVVILEGYNRLPEKGTGWRFDKGFSWTALEDMNGNGIPDSFFEESGISLQAKDFVLFGVDNGPDKTVYEWASVSIRDAAQVYNQAPFQSESANTTFTFSPSSYGLNIYDQGIAAHDWAIDQLDRMTQGEHVSKHRHTKLKNTVTVSIIDSTGEVTLLGTGDILKEYKVKSLDAGEYTVHFGVINEIGMGASQTIPLIVEGDDDTEEEGAAAGTPSPTPGTEASMSTGV